MFLLRSECDEMGLRHPSPHMWQLPSSSLSLEDTEGLLLEITSDFTGMAVRLGSFTGQLVEGKLFFLFNLDQVDLNGVVAVSNTSKSS